MNDDNASERSEARRNFWLVVGNGIISNGAFALFDPSLVIAAFIVQTGGSDILIGFAATMSPLGFSWPQVFVANLVQPMPRKLSVYRWGMVFRIGTLALLCALMWAFRQNLPPWFPYALVGIMFVHWSFTGISSVPWFEVLSKIVTPENRPVVFAWRQSGGQLMAVGAGAVIGWALSERSGLQFPDGYLLLLVLLTVLLTIALGMFAVVREPVDPEAIGERRPWGEYFRLGPRIVREDANYRRLLVGNLSFAVGLAGTPFMVPFLIRRIGMSDSVVGPLMMMTSAVTVVLTLYYGWLGRRRGNRAVIVLAAWLGVVSPALAFVAGVAPPMTVLSLDVRFVVIAAALMFSRVSMFAMSVGRNNYLLDIAPTAERPTYVGFWMTAALVTTFVPMVAGVVVEALGYTAVFGICAALAVVSLATLVRLAEPRAIQVAHERHTAEVGARA